MEHSVDVKNLTKRFGDFTAVNGVSFRSRRARYSASWAPTARGKAPPSRCSAGILMPTSGERARDGPRHHDGAGGDQEQHRVHVAEVLPLRRPDGRRRTSSSSAASTGWRARGSRSGWETSWRWPGIGDSATTQVKSLPGGIKQRLALGGAMLHDPPMLFLDEPTSGVDPLMRRNFWELIYAFAGAGKTDLRHHPLHGRGRALRPHRAHHRGEDIALDSPAG